MKKCLQLLLVLFPVCGWGQIISTFVGTGINGCTTFTTAATTARVHDPLGCTFDKNGNFYFANQQCNLVCKITPSGTLTTVAGGGTSLGDGGAATLAGLNYPNDVTFDTSGNLYIADAMHYRIRKIDMSTMIITTIAGTGTYGFSGDGGQATAAKISGVNGLCFDKNNNLFISDCNNSRIRRIDVSGIISTIVGTGVSGYSGDGGPATSAKIYWPFDLAFDKVGNLYFPDMITKNIRKIDTNGIISTIAGCDSVAMFNGDGIPATAAHVGPYKIAFDSIGNIFTADSNGRIRQIDTNGIIHTLAGTGVGGYSGDGGRADSAEISDASGIAVDGCGNVYFGDVGNARIRKVTLPQSPTDTPTLTLTASTPDTICAGTSVTYTATHTHGGSYTLYRWYVNATAISGATDSFYNYTPANGDSVYCIISTWNRCSSVSNATSNTIHMVVNPLVTPTISISPSPNDTICMSTTVTYTATVSGGGSGPAYQWKVNGSNVGTSAAGYTYTPTNGDSVQCVFTSNAGCATDTIISSNTINMVVYAITTPTISIAPSPNDTVCAGTAVTYTATITGGGSLPSYIWYVNGTVTGATGSSYTYSPANGDSVRCALTSSAPCVSTAAVSSNIINMVVNPTVIPGITITASPNDTICGARIVSFSSVIAGGGSAPGYQWFVNGAGVGSGSGYSYTPANGDTVLCVLTSDAPCASPASIASNSIIMVVDILMHPTIMLSGPSAIAIGNPVTIAATITGAGSSYTIHWFNFGTEFTSTTVPSVTYTKVMTDDSITARIVSKDFCVDSAVSGYQLVWEDKTEIHSTDGYRYHNGGMTCYPNPVLGELHIVSPYEIDAVTITDLLGREVYSNSDKGNGEYVLNTASLSPGIYIVKVFLSTGGVSFLKLMKE